MIRFVLPLAAIALIAGGCSTSTDAWPIGRTPQSAWNVDPAIPDIARPPAGHPLLGHAIGRGSQIYQCQSDPNNVGQYTWVQTGVEAELVDEQGTVVGRHFTGPTWEASDGSRVTGQKVAAVPQRHAAPWLLLRADSTQGSGSLHNVKYIQRLHTIGGQPPAAVASNADSGREVRVPYTADYYFYGPLVSQ